MQQTFGFIEEGPWRPKRPERLFFGLLPEAGAARRIGRWRDRLLRDRGLDGARIADGRLHLSLHHVRDDWRLVSKFAYAAGCAGAAVEPPPSFDVTLHTLVTFPGAPGRGGGSWRRPLVLLAQDEALFELHRGLGAAMRKHGLRAGETFNPHVTLLYGPGAVRSEPVEPIRFAVTEFALIHSERGLSRYHILRQWPLGPRSVN